mmetsp:Transcript_24015/g.36599  ORF Transcript_24015/g.36599 Transcript_24015/m.36599 type:complete len:420 (+) Transcript_24015:103-1362(+)|eukprot:CAMPEP_0194085640 /NCGR_PEP_ID=MMETSP0149-20130528/18205_1 /TAXON_ID=122233 /ORGANISM="Chaetoceros debilis, Strain MM31A-1" /LENGTH=419 /DNA_ID=CAMNT_0038768573 /DNA_START=109 /DNA_END=1368 /DNA_ORIENTATION=+
MAAKKRKNASKKSQSQASSTTSGTQENKSQSSDSKKSTKEKKTQELDEKVIQSKITVAKGMHFAPTFLLLTIIACSGFMTVMAYRDMFGTGKVVFGQADAAMLHFTGSTKWFDDSRGWKSSQGGFSAIAKQTTDENNMGGFFVRKAAGAAALGFHLQKLVPFILQGENAHWGKGHFEPLLWTGVLGNLALAGYYVTALEDFKASEGADVMGFRIAACLIVEAVVMVGFLIASLLGSSRSKSKSKTKGVKLPPGKGPSSMVSKIAARTVAIVSGLIGLIAGRDFFFSGQELPFPPRDDIYLEWTGAFIHSPPPNTLEADEYGLEAPLHVGDKFISRLLALYLLLTCFQKFVAGFVVRVGNDNSGIIKCKMFWQVQSVADALLLFVVRVFAPAALSASLDVRWHTMCLGYELFILGLYAWY